MKHDLVYTWVNPEDEDLNAMRAAYAAAEVKDQFEYCAGASRYRDNGELRHSIIGALRFLPDLQRIHVACAGRRPKWADEFPLINFVNQSDLIPARFFPLFHSDGIEAFTYKIPDLAEHYVYANDDFFFAAPEPFATFFDTAGAALIGVAPRIAGTPITLEPVFREAEINAVTALRKIGRKPVVGSAIAVWPVDRAAIKARILCLLNGLPAIDTLSHVAQPHRRHAWADFHVLFASEVERLCSHKFRSKSGCAVNLMYAHYMRSRGLARFYHAPSHEYIDARASADERQAFKRKLATNSITRFCLNDVPNRHDDGTWSGFVAEVLHQIYGAAPGSHSASS